MRKILTISAIALCFTTDLSAMRNYPQDAANSHSQPNTRMATIPTAPSRMRLIQYPDGSEYYGEILDGKKHGQGKYTYANKEVYEGAWVNNLPNGHGKYTYKDG